MNLCTYVIRKNQHTFKKSINIFHNRLQQKSKADVINKLHEDAVLKYIKFHSTKYTNQKHNRYYYSKFFCNL